MRPKPTCGWRLGGFAAQSRMGFQPVLAKKQVQNGRVGNPSYGNHVMTKRPGYSLIECLAVIAVSGVVLATATALLHSMFKADRATRDHAAGQQTLRRLAGDFRNDAHAAVKLSAVEAGGEKKSPAWELQWPQGDRKVRYELAAGRFVRDELLGGKVVRREAYRLPEASAATIRVESGTPAVAVLRIATAGPAGAQAGGWPFRIEAALGSDYRFAKLGGK